MKSTEITTRASVSILEIITLKKELEVIGRCAIFSGDTCLFSRTKIRWARVHVSVVYRLNLYLIFLYT